MIWFIALLVILVIGLMIWGAYDTLKELEKRLEDEPTEKEAKNEKHD